MIDEFPPGDVRSLLSAYLDDEVTVAERELVDQALLADPALRRELDETSSIRQQVRDLPLLELPADFAERLERRSPFGPTARPRRRSRTRAAAISALASVAFWGVLVGAGDATQVLPDVAGVFDLHASVVEESAPQPGVGVTADADEMPVVVADLELVRTDERDGVHHFLYSDGTRDVSVLLHHGRVDWDGLPVGQRVDVGRRRGWLGEIDGHPVLVVERGHSVYVIAGGVVDDMVAVSHEMPDSDRDVADRIVDAARSTVDFFGFSG